MDKCLIEVEQKGEVTHISASVGYFKHTKSATLFFCPAIVKPDTTMYIVTDQDTVKVEAMQRDNKNKIVALNTELSASVQNKDGRFWDYIKAHAEKKGYALK